MGKWVACFASLMLSALLFGRSASGQIHSGKTTLQDPMFGISYSYTEVRYEPVPSSVRKVCPDMKYGSFWLFAHTKKESNEFFVVMGVVPGQDGDSLGASLWIRDGKCHVEDSTRMLSGFIPVQGYGTRSALVEMPGLNVVQICGSGVLGECHYNLRSPEEEVILRDLVRDGISRGIQAWGGGERFRIKACAQSLHDASAAMPVVQQELSKFCSRRY